MPTFRLTAHGRQLGLIHDAAWTAFEAKQARAVAFNNLLERSRLTEQDAACLQKKIDANTAGTTQPVASQPLAKGDSVGQLFEAAAGDC